MSLKKKKRQINVIKQKKMWWPGTDSVVHYPRTDLAEYRQFSPLQLLLLGPASSVLQLSLISLGFSDGNWPPSCLSDENWAATVWPTNNLLITSMFSLLNGSFGKPQGEEGVESCTHKAAVCVESGPAWLWGNALAFLSWWATTPVARVD